jgi:hypothetical protein
VTLSPDAAFRADQAAFLAERAERARIAAELRDRIETERDRRY